MNTDPSDFAKVFEDAEKAVSGIKNEKLREIAFEKLVNHLLTGKPNPKNREDEEDEDDGEIKKTKKKGTKKKRARKSTGGNPKPKTDGPKAWITELVDENFFKTPKSSSEIREELETRSHHLKATDLTLPLQSLCHDKRLRRKKEARENGGKAVLHWVNW